MLRVKGVLHLPWLAMFISLPCMWDCAPPYLQVNVALQAYEWTRIQSATESFCIITNVFSDLFELLRGPLACASETILRDSGVVIGAQTNFQTFQVQLQRVDS
jgi:hypothetical protein